MVKLREGIVTYTYSVSIGYNMRTCNTFFFLWFWYLVFSWLRYDYIWLFTNTEFFL